MTSIKILPEDVEDASAALERLQHKHGSSRTLELAAAQVRASGAYLASWTGPSVAAGVLAREAHGLVAEAARGLAVPCPAPRRPADRNRKGRLLKMGRAAAWSVGILTGFVLGLGVSAWALV